VPDQCTNHPDTPAVNRCAGCAEPFCGNCLVEIGAQHYCSSCKVMAVSAAKLPEEAMWPCDEANAALKYSLIGMFCFGFVLGPVGIVKAVKARKLIADDPRLLGWGKALAAIVIGALDVLWWILNLMSRASGV